LAYPHSTRSGRAWPSRLPLAGEPPRTAGAACRSWPGLGRCTLDRSKQQGRRFPRSILEMLASTRRCRVAWFLVAWTQRTHSHRASGVMSSHTSRILAGAAARRRRGPRARPVPASAAQPPRSARRCPRGRSRRPAGGGGRGGPSGPGAHPAAYAHLAIRQVLEPPIDAGSRGLDLPVLREHKESGCVGVSGSVASPKSSERRAPSARWGATCCTKCFSVSSNIG